MSLSAVYTEVVRRERQRDARVRVEKWLGSAGELTPQREAEILAEWGETSTPPAGSKAALRAKPARRKRA